MLQQQKSSDKHKLSSAESDRDDVVKKTAVSCTEECLIIYLIFDVHAYCVPSHGLLCVVTVMFVLLNWKLYQDRHVLHHQSAFPMS